MAEGGNFSRTLEGGSEFLFDHECSECHIHGLNQEATEFCKECKQLLCKTCGRYHIRYMKTHTLVSVATMSQSKLTQPTVRPVPLVAKCHYHPDRDIEMHCGTHDMVYCSLCVAKEHRSCVNVKEIKEVAHRSKLSTLQTLVTDITKIGKQLLDAKMEKSNNLKLIKKKKASLLQEINSVRKRMNKHLDALEQKIIAELDAEQNQLEKEINADIKVADDLIIVSTQRKPDLTSDYDETQMFIIEKLARVVLTEADSFLKNANSSKHPTLKFEQNDELCNAIKKSDNIGKITKQENKPTHIQPRNYSVKSKKNINIKVKSDNNDCFITGMCQLPDGTILLIDYRNKKLKRLDDQLKVKDFLACEASPQGLCSVSATEVAVRLVNNTVQFVSVGKSLTYQQQFSIKHSKPYYISGMACCNNQLWIPGDKAVYVYSLSGSLMKTIESDSNGRKIFPVGHPCHIAVNNDGTKVYVTAWADRVVVFNKNGDVITELHDQRLDGTRGICITEDDIVLVAAYYSENVLVAANYSKNVLVAANYSYNVVMFDRDDNSLGELVPSTDMLPYPCSLCYDRQGCQLLVGYNADKVQIFQLTR